MAEKHRAKLCIEWDADPTIRGMKFIVVLQAMDKYGSLSRETEPVELVRWGGPRTWET